MLDSGYSLLYLTSQLCESVASEESHNFQNIESSSNVSNNAQNIESLSATDLICEDIRKETVDVLDVTLPRYAKRRVLFCSYGANQTLCDCQR